MIAINNDQLMFCNGNSIVLIRPSTSEITVLLGNKQGINDPRSIAFCKAQRKLFLATWGTKDIVMVFKQT